MSEKTPVSGILEVHDKGYGFLRKPEKGSAAAPGDVFVPPDFIRRNGLRDGVSISGTSVMNGRGPQLAEIEQLNDKPVEAYKDQIPFEELTTINPNRWIRLETAPENYSTRVIDLMTPIGHGQRAMIVAPPRSGKTMLMQAIADGVAKNHPKAFLMIVLVDERPEEVTEFRKFIQGRGELWSSSNDQDVQSHVRLSKLVIERAKRLVEAGRDVFMVLDSLTRLGRAFNNAMRGNGRTLSGGMDARGMEIPRKIFAAARQTEEAGSLSIVATALIDTGSRMDEVIFQEFKGTGNMELVLDRKLSDRRVWPAIDISQSGTRREEKLLDPDTLHAVNMLRRTLSTMHHVDAMEQLTKQLAKFKSNSEFIKLIAGAAARD